MDEVIIRDPCEECGFVLCICEHLPPMGAALDLQLDEQAEILAKAWAAEVKIYFEEEGLMALGRFGPEDSGNEAAKTIFRRLLEEGVIYLT